jgi:hypothetical protein
MCHIPFLGWEVVHILLPSHPARRGIPLPKSSSPRIIFLRGAAFRRVTLSPMQWVWGLGAPENENSPAGWIVALIWPLASSARLEAGG